MSDEKSEVLPEKAHDKAQRQKDCSDDGKLLVHLALPVGGHRQVNFKSAVDQ